MLEGLKRWFRNFFSNQSAQMLSDLITRWRVEYIINFNEKSKEIIFVAKHS